MKIFNRYATLSQLMKEAPFTFVMLVINVAVYLFGFILDFFGISLFQEGALYGPFVVELGQYYRVITSAFLHSGLIHLAFNMIVGMYLLTAGLERVIGTKKTAAIYFISMILSGVAVILFNYAYPTVGASGAIFGALGSLLYISVYRQDLMTRYERQWIWQLIVINLIFTLLWGNISVPGHLGGLASGYLISYLFIKRNPDDIIYNSNEYYYHQHKNNDDDDDDENSWYKN
jgi:rhomboid protease GluP